MQKENRYKKIDVLTRVGTMVLALSVLLIVIIKIDLIGGLPRGGLSWVLLVLACGYMVHILLRRRFVSVLFGFLCLACGGYMLWFYSGDILPGLLVLASGALVLYNLIV
ncbi:Uncharacterised protein [uncultured archaeon]|nr:Uncharacterised protein [uncultured archaeon]